MPDYLRVQDIVERMNVAEETVRIWIRKKQLPAIRIGRDYFEGSWLRLLWWHRHIWTFWRVYPAVPCLQMRF